MERESKMNEVDQRILYLIKHLKLIGKEKTIDAIYEKVGVIEQTVYKIRKGEKYFTVKHIYNFRKHYGVSLEWIYGFSDEIFTHFLHKNEKQTNQTETNNY